MKMIVLVDFLQGHFLEFLLGGLSYPDDSVKSAVVYILVQICSKNQENLFSTPLVQKMCSSISSNLATAKSQELTINLLGKNVGPFNYKLSNFKIIMLLLLLGLVRHIIKNGVYAVCLLNADKASTDSKGALCIWDCK